MGYRLWPRSDLVPGISTGQRSFHKLLGPSRGPGSRGRVSPRPCQAPPVEARWGVPPPFRGRDVSLGRGPKPHLAYAPRGRHTPLPLGGFTCVLAAPPPGPYRGDRVILGQGVSPTYPPPQGLRLAGPGAVSSRPTPATGGTPCDSLRPPSRGWLWGVRPGRLPPGDSPAHGEPLPPGLIRRSPLRGGSTIRVSRGHPHRHELGQRR